MTYKAPSREALQAQCDAFNFDCTIGGRVAVKLDGTDKPLITTTRSEAQILSGHSAVVWLNGVRGCYDLSHVTPIPEAAKEAWAVLADSGNVIYWEHDRDKVSEVARQHRRPYGPYTPPELDSTMRRVPRLPTPKQLRAALRVIDDPELAKAVYLAMTSAEAVTPEEPTSRIPK